MKFSPVRVLVTLVVAVGMVLFGNALSATAAAVRMADTITPESTEFISFVFSWVSLIQFALQIVFPLLVAIVTTRFTAGRTRGLILAAITVVTTVLNAVVQGLLGMPVELFGVLLTAGFGFLVSVGFHFGLWGASGPVDPQTGEPAPSVSAALIRNVGRTR